ncbi:hypothetical protein FQU76_25420 [Streptomyces qinzhouensis]|uniref:Uncharacterized protein n=1 Tax=Streptomyces qinzhouensis TaxID=2599401 RepID=A0A5B8JHI1_9ACTN|nr:hypothetical protein FQU76_25420 [Streptomyces qinzhouensis]
MGADTPWEPQIDDIVRDSETNRIGRVMDRFGVRYSLRPLKGGCEWEARPGDLHPVTMSDLLSTAVAELNQRSSKGVL